MHNSFPSKSIFKSVIHLCYHPDVTTPLNNSDQLTQSVTELLWNMCGNLARVIMKKYDHRIGKIFVLSWNLVTSTVFTDNPCVIIGTPDSNESYCAPPVYPRRSQLSSCCSDLRGAGRLHPAFCQSWNLDRTFPVRAKLSGLKLPTSSQSSFGYDTNIMSVGRTVGWNTGGALHCDISSCDDVQILRWPLLLSL